MERIIENKESRMDLLVSAIKGEVDEETKTILSIKEKLNLLLYKEKEVNILLKEEEGIIAKSVVEDLYILLNKVQKNKDLLLNCMNHLNEII